MTNKKDNESFTITQVSKATNLSVYTLRYYEQSGLIEPIKRSTGNQRRYTATDIKMIGFLIRLKQTNMPISQMQKYAKLRRQGDSTIQQRLELLKNHQQQLQQQITSLEDHAKALTEKIQAYQKMLAGQPISTDKEI